MAAVGVTCQVDTLVQDIGCLMLSVDEEGYSSQTVLKQTMLSSRDHSDPGHSESANPFAEGSPAIRDDSG